MTTDLMYLTWTALFTSLLFLPYTNALVMKHGLSAAVGNRDKEYPLAAWAERLKRAHLNAVENLVVFAAVVLVAHVSGKHNAATAMAALIYFWCRVGHVVIYTAGIIWARTLIWVASWICVLAIIWQILS